MADTTKPAETAPVAEPVVETKPTEETPVVAAATETAAPAAEPEAPTAEEAKKDEEVKPVEEGALAHKPEGASFPKNLLHSKKFFWFGSEPIDLKSTSSFKADKAADVAHHVTAWAAETGKGLLFFGEKDKNAPQGAIHLADASEPVNDGTNKFHFTSKGHKHSFKAASASERDAWVAQIKAKIAEAKELVASVTESEKYKAALEALNPAKKEKTPEPTPAPEAAAAETVEAPTTEATAEAPAAATEETKEDAPAPKEEEPKRRSASRKRASIFGSLLGKKEEKKAEPVAEPEAVAESSTVAAEAPAAEAPKEETATPTEAATEAKAEDKKEEAAEAKPTPAKRASLFGNLSFGKKKVASPEPTPATEEAPATTEAVAETAPVIPAVETTEPLSTEVTSPVTAPVETTEVAPATNGETKEVKSEKRKSSIPFIGGFLNKEKATSGDESEKPKSPSPFSKLRATIKGKKEAKAEEKVEEKVEETPAPAAEATTAEAAPAAAATEEASKPAEETAAVEPAKPVAAPVVTAAA